MPGYKNKIKKMSKCFGILALVLSILPSCISHARYVDIDTKPTGATIFVDGEQKGVTHSQKLKLDFSGDPTRRILIQISKPRYKPIFQYWSIDEVPELKKVFTMEAD